MKRSAWFLRTSDFSSVIGALGDDQTKEWPGAIMPALPQLVPAATAVVALEKHDLVAVFLQLVSRGHADDAAPQDHNAHNDSAFVNNAQVNTDSGCQINI